MSGTEKIIYAGWSTQGFTSEGGRKIHLAVVVDDASRELCPVPARYDLPMHYGLQIDDVHAWLATDASGEVCGLCRRAVERMFPRREEAT